MSRSHSPNGTHMRYECDGCDARVSSPEGVLPRGWLVTFSRDICGGCAERESLAQARREAEAAAYCARNGVWPPSAGAEPKGWRQRARKERRS